MADFTNLEVFHKAHALALNVIRVSLAMRGPVGLAIRGQMVRAALSAPTNIVEGSAKGSDREFARFINIAIASISELEYHLIVGRDTQLISQRDFESLFHQLVDVRKMLAGLQRRLKAGATVKAGSRSAGSR